MSWQVELLKNTIKVSKECIEELWNYNEKNTLYLWYLKEDVTVHGILYFNPDLILSIDYLYDYPEIIEILKKYKVEGCVCFGSLEVAEGAFWGHEFDGKGGYKKLKGILTFLESDKS